MADTEKMGWFDRASVSRKAGAAARLSLATVKRNFFSSSSLEEFVSDFGAGAAATVTGRWFIIVVKKRPRCIFPLTDNIYSPDFISPKTT